MHNITRFNGENKFFMCCDFCAKNQIEDGAELIASPNGTHICFDCVAICSKIISDKAKDK